MGRASLSKTELGQFGDESGERLCSYNGLVPGFNLIRSASCVALAALAGLTLAACSGAGESARYKTQAEQYVSAGRLPEAVLTYRQALISEPNNPGLLRGLGTALAAQGRNRSAAIVLERVTILAPEDDSIKKSLAALIMRPQDGLSLNLAWIVTPLQAEPIGAAVASDRIFVVYASGRLIALDQVTGHVLWQAQAPVALVSPPAVDGDQVWVGAEDGSIYVYAAGSGQQLGRVPTKGAVYAAPALTPAMAFCPSNDGSLYAVDRGSLELVWKANIGTALHASPLVREQAVYVGANDGGLYKLSASRGERIWPGGILTQGAIETVPTLAGGRIYVGSDDGRIYALDAETGGQYWRYSTPEAIFADPLVFSDQLVVASSGQVLASLRLSDGSPSWSLAFEHPLTETPALFKGRLYVTTSGDPHLWAVDLQSGKLLGELDSGDWIAQGPLVAGSDLILLGKDGAVFLYR